MGLPVTNFIQFPLTASSEEMSIVYSTTIIEGANGQEVRNANWQDPRFKFNLKFTIRQLPDIAVLQAFFHICKGRETAFLYKAFQDHSISQAAAGNLTGTGGSQTIQIKKTYVDVLSNYYQRTVTKYKASSLKVYENGTLKTSGITTSEAAGTFTFNSLAGSTITYEVGEYYFPVRFDTDELPVGLENYFAENLGNALLPDIPAIEVR